MRIRTQLRAAVVLAALVVLCVAVMLASVTARSRVAFAEQAEAQRVAHGVVSMLALTNEFIVFGGERVVSQWRSRHAQLVDAVVATLGRQRPPSPELIDLQRNLGDLPPLFDTLVTLNGQPASSFTQRRRELMLERLQAEMQEVLEARRRWAVAIDAAQRSDQQVYTWMVLAAPAALSVLLVAAGLLVARRVLAPLLKLQAAVQAMQAGDLHVRCGSDTADEIGDTARAVDSMAQALQQQGAALQASERRIRLITDAVPALIGHVDLQERYTFVNAAFGELDLGPPQAMLGRSVRAVCGDVLYERLGPQYQRALAGEPVTFETMHRAGGRNVRRESRLLPDVDAGGRVQGVYLMALDITARKEAELKLADSEQLLASVADNVPAMVAYVDHECRYRFANVKHLTWLGVEPSTLIGRSVRDGMGEAFWQMVEPRFAGALAGRTVRSDGTRTVQGVTREFMTTHTPDLDASGAVRGCFVLSVDISERHAAERALAASERRLHELIDSIPAQVGYFDMGQRCRFANHAARRSQRVELAELSGISLRGTLGDDSYVRHAPAIRQVLAGRPAVFDGSVQRAGHADHFQAHLIPDFGSAGDGEQRGFYVMSFDVTALKEAQQAQARSERQLRGITDNLPGMIAYIDDEQRYVFVNGTYRDWLGIEPALAVGRTMTDTLGEAAFEPRREFIARALAGERAEFDVEAQTLLGPKHLQIVYVPDVQPDGSVAGVYALTTDVTVLKQIEQQLQQLSRIDGLTSLPNRRQFEEKLSEGVARAARARRPIALMFLDIDHFKSINDTLGHAAGDSVLKEFATRLKGSVRRTDTPARLAGDEFVILLEGLRNKNEAELVAEKVVAAMREPFWVDDEPLAVTTSLGVAYCERPGRDTQLMEAADQALYHAKGAGRNTFRMSSMEPVVTGFGELAMVR